MLGASPVARTFTSSEVDSGDLADLDQPGVERQVGAVGAQVRVDALEGHALPHILTVSAWRLYMPMTVRPMVRTDAPLAAFGMPTQRRVAPTLLASQGTASVGVPAMSGSVDPGTVGTSSR